jgi:hypothetical protein
MYLLLHCRVDCKFERNKNKKKPSGEKYSKRKKKGAISAWFSSAQKMERICFPKRRLTSIGLQRRKYFLESPV